MSRRLPGSQRPRVILHPTLDNPYQDTTESFNIQHKTNTQRPTHYLKESYHTKCTSVCPNGCSKAACHSDDTFTDSNTYYEYYPDGAYHHSPQKDSRTTEYFFSDDSASTRLPQYEYEEISSRRHSRNAFSDRSSQRKHGKNGKVINTVLVHKDVRRVYPNQENELDRLYHEVVDRRTSSESASNLPRRDISRSRLSSRPQSSQSSLGASAVVDGCGGRCQTFENVCYYFLQVAFTMGILIGTSLCIAGAVLRKSAARNLQVLVYIGAMLSLVSALLLGVQCNARNSARKRKKALRNAKRAPIPLDVLHTRGVNVPVQQQTLMVVDECPQRSHPSHVVTAYPQRSILINSNTLMEQQGIPWWRRKDLGKT